MKRITLYRHPACERCRKMSRVHAFFDWFGRVECSTETPPTGPLKPGEIVVHDHRSGEFLRGIDAIRMVARQIPAYLPLRPLLHVPPIARAMDAMVRGCDDGTCAAPSVSEPARAAERVS
jgi:hypothetical protein